jgi:hypothetical protein
VSTVVRTFSLSALRAAKSGSEEAEEAEEEAEEEGRKAYSKQIDERGGRCIG